MDDNKIPLEFQKYTGSRESDSKYLTPWIRINTIELHTDNIDVRITIEEMLY